MTHSDIVYAIWQEKHGKKEPRFKPGLRNRINAQSIVDEWNEEEAELSKMESRPVDRRFFLVKETTTYEEV